MTDMIVFIGVIDDIEFKFWSVERQSPSCG